MSPYVRLSCDWDAANHFLSENEDAKSARISVHRGTVLHVAVLAGHTEIVEKLVELMSANELEIKDNNGVTALAQAAILQNNTGNGMLDCMLRKNTNLLNIRDNSNRIPLIAALEYGNTKRALYLSSASQDYDQRLSDIDASTVLTQFILHNDFDLALHFLHRCPRAAIVPNMYDSSPLAALAEMSCAFPSGMQLDPEEKRIYDSIPIPSEHSTNEIEIDIHSPGEHQSDQAGINRSGNKRNLLERKKLHHQAALQLLSPMCSQVKQMNGDSVSGAIFQAIKGGIIEFIDEIIKVESQLLYITDIMGRNILFYAVLYRQDEIFHHILRKLEELDVKNSILNARDNSSNTILHMAAMLESSHCTKSDSSMGEVSKIQSELKWFKEVERNCLPWIKEIRNDAKITARELFTHTHKDMMKEGKTWMKGTATSSIVIGALIITIMFTAVITVPGDYNQNTGFPIFSHKLSFVLFITYDALSLLSTMSVLIFLEILTLHYSEEDFLEHIPKKMIWGYYTLFLSIEAMMITFIITLFIILPNKLSMLNPVFFLAYIPVHQFGSMFLKLVRTFKTIGLARWCIK